MTIWSKRTPRSIVSGFTAAPVGDNRILRSVAPWAGGAYRVPYSVVPDGRRATYGAAAPTGAAALSQSDR